jgi:hypothetical protein
LKTRGFLSVPKEPHPFAYLAATGVLYVKADPDDPQAPVAFIAALLIGFGLLVSASTFHIRRRINQTVDDIAELENILSLRRTVVHWNWAMISPYFAMIAVGIIASLAAIIWTR